MDESMIDRIAAALVSDRLSMTEISFRFDEEPGELRDARAAVAAMREPTDAMIAAASAKLNDPEIRTFKLAAQTAWKAMIDEALMDR